MRQLYRAHAMLFVCAYVGLLGYTALTEPHAVRFTADEQPQLLSAAPSPGVIENTPEAPEEHVADVAIEVAPSTAVSADEVRQEERARISEVALQATRADEPQKRAEAIDQLNTVTPETLQALQAVITSDSAVRNRIRAVNSLAVLANQEGAQDAVISILNLAMSDTNASVVSRANQVYRDLTQASVPVEQ